MVHYQPVKVTIDAPSLADVIIDVVVRHHGLPLPIVTNRGSLFTSKFWSSLCYFLGIKQRVSIVFNPQTDGQTERQNNMMEAYLRVFVNFEQNEWARLLPMAEFPWNNAKNASTGYTSFELNCGYHPRVSYDEDLNPCSKSRTAEKTILRAPRVDDRVLAEPPARPKNGWFTTSFTYCCWNRIPQRRGKWMIRSWISSSRLATTRSMRLMAFGTARSMPKSQQANYQGFTIWSCGKAILRRRIPGSLHRRSSTFEGSSPPTTKTIQKSRQRHLTPSIQLRRWLGHPLHPGQ